MSTQSISNSKLMNMKFSELHDVAKSQPNLFKKIFSQVGKNYKEASKKLFIKMHLVNLCINQDNDEDLKTQFLMFHKLIFFSISKDYEKHLNKIYEKLLTSALKKKQVSLVSKLIKLTPDCSFYKGTEPSKSELSYILDLACKKGYLELVQLFIEDNEEDLERLFIRSPKYNDERIPPIHLAVKYGHLHIVKLINEKIEHFLSRMKDDYSVSAFDLAVKHGHLDIVEFLLDHPDCDFIDSSKRELACENGHLEIYKLLIPIEIAKEGHIDYDTDLIRAAENGHSEIVQFILSQPSGHSSAFEKKALILAIERGHLDVVRCLLENKIVDAVDDEQRTPLCLAIRNGHLDIVELLLKYPEVNIEKVAGYNSSALHVAVRSGHKDIVNYLLEKKANVEAVDFGKRTSLHFAVRMGNEDIIQLLLNHKANIEAKGKDGYTPLHLAAKEGEEKIVELLLKNHADIEARDERQSTPLYIAVQEGDVKIVKILLQNQASAEAQDDQHYTPIHYATSRSNIEILKLLLEKTPNLKTDLSNIPYLHLAIVAHKAEEIVPLLIEKQANLNAKEEKNGYTPLCTAIIEGKKDIAKLLIEKGAEVKAQGKNGKSALDLAIDKGMMDIAQLLIARGAPFDLKIATIFEQGRVDLFSLFMEQKKKEKTPLDEWFQSSECQYCILIALEKKTLLKFLDESEYEPQLEKCLPYHLLTDDHKLLFLHHLSPSQIKETIESRSVAQRQGYLSISIPQNFLTAGQLLAQIKTQFLSQINWKLDPLDYIDNSRFLSCVNELKKIPYRALAALASSAFDLNFLRVFNEKQLRVTVPLIPPGALGNFLLDLKKPKQLEILMAATKQQKEMYLNKFNLLFDEVKTILKIVDEKDHGKKSSMLNAYSRHLIANIGFLDRLEKLILIDSLNNEKIRDAREYLKKASYATLLLCSELNLSFHHVFKREQLGQIMLQLLPKDLMEFMSQIRKDNHLELLAVATEEQKEIYLQQTDLLSEPNKKFLDQLEKIISTPLAQEKIAAARDKISDIQPVKSSGKEEELSDDYNCSITFSIALDPVIDKHGKVYDKKNIIKWLDANKGLDPNRAVLKWEDEIEEEDKTKCNYLKSTCYLLAPFKTDQSLSKEETETLILHNLDDLDLIERDLLDAGADAGFVRMKKQDTQIELIQIASKAGLIPDNKNLTDRFEKIGLKIIKK